MKVLHILDHSVPLFSGYSFRSRSIIHAQRELGMRPVVLTSPKHRSEGDTAENIDGIVYHRSKELSRRALGAVPFLSELKLMLRMTSRIEEIVRQDKVELIHSHSPLLNGLPALWVARRLGVPLVYEARAFWEDAAVDHGTFGEDSLRYRVSRELESFLFKHANRGVTICESMRQDLRSRGVSVDRISVVPNGVNIEEFHPGERRNSLSEKLGLDGGLVFGFIGSFYRYEGLRFLLESFPAIRSRIPNAHLLLVGGGEEEEILKKLAQGRKGVHFTGRIPHQHIMDYYSLIDIFVCARLRMRLTELVTPLKPLESMAMEKAVLASDVGGHKELIDHGRTGWLFAAEDTEDLVAQALCLSEDSGLRTMLGENGRRFVVEERSWKDLSRRYLEIYNDAVNSNGKKVLPCQSLSEERSNALSNGTVGSEGSHEKA
jgi:PEP-CTERM/exosortase A-associated glycosyltransferase